MDKAAGIQNKEQNGARKFQRNRTGSAVMTAIADNPNTHVALHSCGSHHDLRMACPMHLIAGVKITNIKRGGVIVDRRITVVVDCGCKYEVSLPLHKRAPRRGEPSHCHGNHKP